MRDVLPPLIRLSHSVHRKSLMALTSANHKIIKKRAKRNLMVFMKKIALASTEQLVAEWSTMHRFGWRLGSTRFTMRLFVIFFFLFIAIASAFEAKDEVPCSDDSQCAQKQCPPGETAKCVDMGKKLCACA
uniref:Late nodulin n=1 Tax=Bursaphelenchus xylophilus TaxID=6326 RepID=A0A1I7S848_BURXY